MPKIVFDFDRLADRTLNKIGGILVEQAKDNMAKVSYGRVYIVGGKKHIASKGGDTANNMTGALSDTIRFEIQGKKMEFGAGNTKVNYAKYLELGTKKMDKRPNYTKSIIQNEAKIDAEVQRLFKNSLGFR